MAGIDILLNVTSATVTPTGAPAKNPGGANPSSEFGDVLADAVRQDPSATGSNPGRTSPASADSSPTADRGTPATRSDTGTDSSKPAAQDPARAGAAEPRRDDQHDEPLAAEAAGSVAAANAQQTPQSDASGKDGSPDQNPVETGAAVVPLNPLPSQATLAAPASLAALVSDVVAAASTAQSNPDDGSIDVSSLAGTLVEQLPTPPEVTATVEVTSAATSASKPDVVVPPTGAEAIPALADVVVEVVVSTPETAVESANGNAATTSAPKPTASALPQAAVVDVVPPAESTVKPPTIPVVQADSAKPDDAPNPNAGPSQVQAVQATIPVPVPKPVAVTPEVAEVQIQPVAAALAKPGDSSETASADAEPVVVEAKPAARASVTGTLAAAPAGLLTGLWDGVVVTGRAAERSSEPVNAVSGEADLSGGDWSQLLGGDPLNGVVPTGGQGGAAVNGSSGVAGAAAVTGASPVSATRSDVEPVLDQVTSGVVASHRGGHEVRLRLNPPELGSLLIDVAVREGVVTARLETTQSGTQQLLTDNIHQLRDALAQQGLAIDKIDVSMNDPRQDNSRGDQGSTGMSFSDGRNRDDQPAAAPIELPDEISTRSTKAAVPRPQFLGAGKSTGLDVEV